MIWHIFKKDWTLLWPFVLIAAATHVINAGIWLILGYFGEPAALRALAGNFILAPFFAVAALTVTLVHQDVLPGDRQDWLVRPAYRRDLILAKLLFLLVAIQGPMLLVDLVQCLATGFNFPDSLSAALSRNIYLLVILSLPMFALAAMTSTIIEVIGGVMVICLIAVLFMVALDSSTSDQMEGIFATMSNGWLMIEFWQAAMLATAAIVIPLQYFHRATRRARFITLGAVLLLIPISASIPFEAAFAVLQSVSPDPAAAKSITIAFDPGLGKFALAPGSLNPANSVWLPLNVSGLVPDSIVLNDRTNVRIFGRDGAVLYHGLTTGGTRTATTSDVVPGLLAVNDFPVRTTAGGDVRTHQFIVLPGKIFERVRSQPVRIELDYSLTLFRIETSDTIAALNGAKQIAHLGFCKTKMDDDGDEVQISCRGIGTPVSCGTAILVNTVTGQQNPPYSFCDKLYLPYNAHFDPNAMTGFGGGLRFRDLQGLAKYPVDSTQLANARVSVKTYAPVAHFTRHLIIPEIRLGDWEANVPGGAS